MCISFPSTETEQIFRNALHKSIGLRLKLSNLENSRSLSIACSCIWMICMSFFTKRPPITVNNKSVWQKNIHLLLHVTRLVMLWWITGKSFISKRPLLHQSALEETRRGKKELYLTVIQTIYAHSTSARDPFRNASMQSPPCIRCQYFALPCRK